MTQDIEALEQAWFAADEEYFNTITSDTPNPVRFAARFGYDIDLPRALGIAAVAAGSPNSEMRKAFLAVLAAADNVYLAKQELLLKI